MAASMKGRFAIVCNMAKVRFGCPMGMNIPAIGLMVKSLAKVLRVLQMDQSMMAALPRVNPKGLAKSPMLMAAPTKAAGWRAKLLGKVLQSMQMAPDTKADSAKRCIMVAVCWSTPMDTSMTAIGSMASKKATPKSHIPMVRSIQAMSCAVRARGVADWKCQKD